MAAMAVHWQHWRAHPLRASLSPSLPIGDASATVRTPMAHRARKVGDGARVRGVAIACTPSTHLLRRVHLTGSVGQQMPCRHRIDPTHRLGSALGPSASNCAHRGCENQSRTVGVEAKHAPKELAVSAKRVGSEDSREH
jgi:hypothetical protein